MEGRLFTYTFLEEYQNNIQPALSEIDVFLKTAEYPLYTGDVACVLDIEEAEVIAILEEIGVGAIDRKAFLSIMQRGSSQICRLYEREMQLGSPQIYTASQIAYIYNLDIGLVKNACQKLQIKEVTNFTIPFVFAQIPRP